MIVHYFLNIICKGGLSASGDIFALGLVKVSLPAFN